jgi:hypothetical protein
VPFYNPLPGTFLCFYPAANNCGFTVALTPQSRNTQSLKYIGFFCVRKEHFDSLPAANQKSRKTVSLAFNPSGLSYSQAHNALISG